MDITNKTTVGEAAPFLKAEHLDELLKSDKITPMPYGKTVFEMTVGEFLESLTEDYGMKYFQDPNELLVVAVGRLKFYQKQMEDVQKLLKLNEYSLSSEEQAAQRGVVFPSFEENVLCECVDWFHLHSLDEAEKIPLSNYLIYRRKKSAEALFERNLNKIYNEKAKVKKK